MIYAPPSVWPKIAAALDATRETNLDGAYGPEPLYLLPPPKPKREPRPVIELTLVQPVQADGAAQECVLYPAFMDWPAVAYYLRGLGFVPKLLTA